MPEFSKVAEATALPPGSSLCVDFNGERVALFNVDGSVYAIGDTCTHVGGRLSEGEVEGTTVKCPLHGATFDLMTGEVRSPPAGSGVPCYQARVQGDAIEVTAG